MNTTEQLTYSNPRKDVVIEDWPSGKFKTKAVFAVEAKGDKERAVRTTYHPILTLRKLDLLMDLMVDCT